MNTTENSDTFEPQEEQEHARTFQAFLQSLLTTMAMGLLNSFIREFQFWTRQLANRMQLAWSGIIQAFYLSFDVIRFTLMEAIRLAIRGTRQCSLLPQLFKMAFLLIFNIFKGSLQAIMDLWKVPDYPRVSEIPENEESKDEESKGEESKDEEPTEATFCGTENLNQDEVDEVSLD